MGKASDLEGQKEVLPAREVSNTVQWVNPEIHAPMTLEVGVPTDVALFLTPVAEGAHASLEVMSEHGRSVLLGRTLFSDAQGTVFREIDLKGAGHVLKDEFHPEKRSALRVGPLQPRHNPARPEELATQGIVDLQDAEKDKEHSEYFFHQGVRVARVIALVALQEVVDDQGHVISVLEAKERGLIHHGTSVGLEIRAFVTKARVSESRAENWELLLEDARHLVAQELGQDPEKFSKREYVQWFAQTLGAQVGKMHRLGYGHGYLTPQNVTLDCRLVDFDSVFGLDETKEEQRRLMEAKLAKLLGFKPQLSNVRDLARVFDYCRAFATLDQLAQDIGLRKPDDAALLKMLSTSFEEKYLEEAGESLPEV